MTSLSLYESLAPGEIRVFSIDYATEGSITGSLRTINIAANNGSLGFFTRLSSPYEALSYYWGDPAKVFSIYCNNQEVRIHANLQDALVVLRQQCQGVPVWTDAICINQQDPEERISQIRLMAKIYQRARKVWAYLGNATEGTPKAVAILLTLCDAAKQLEDRILAQFGEGFVQSSSSRFTGLHHSDRLPPPGAPFWASVARLVHGTEYFDRLWVLQEVAFAKEVEFLCGKHRIPWLQVKMLFGVGVAQIAGMRPLASSGIVPINRSVFEAREFLSNEYFGQVVGSGLNLMDRCIGWISASGIFSPEYHDSVTFAKTASDMAEKHKMTHFRNLLDFSAQQTCSEPKDRILAMLGLFDAKLGKTSYPWTGEESTERIYIEAFYYLINGDASLQMLSMVPVDTRKNPQLPSWCPDFDYTRDKKNTSY